VSSEMGPRRSSTREAPRLPTPVRLESPSGRELVQPPDDRGEATSVYRSVQETMQWLGGSSAEMVG
jgi:hypothetical protein